jgi:hypothetical protein
LKTLRTTLIADESSDHRVLTPIITLLLDEVSPHPFQLVSAEPLTGGHALETRLPQAMRLFPCDVLLVHRDAEGTSPAEREAEVKRALANAKVQVPVVCVVPVRMTEAWLLVNERAIRAAVGNPNGGAGLKLPTPDQVESVPAKDRLIAALEAATELGVNRRRRFQPLQYRHRVAEELLDLTCLRALPSFQRFEQVLRHCLAGLS